jgi:hypothetical protein
MGGTGPRYGTEENSKEIARFRNGSLVRLPGASANLSPWFS